MNITQVRRNDSMSSPQTRSPRRTTRLRDHCAYSCCRLSSFLPFFLFIPFSDPCYYSLFNWNGLGPATKFVGLNNFK